MANDQIEVPSAQLKRIIQGQFANATGPASVRAVAQVYVRLAEVIDALVAVAVVPTAEDKVAELTKLKAILGGALEGIATDVTALNRETGSSADAQ